MGNDMNWSFYQIWNLSLTDRKARVLQPRERIWASELGGAMVDRYLKMKAVEPSNPPNPRSLRKFEAGNIWESIVGYVLKRAGILESQQDWLKYQYEGLLPVTGKLDFIAGGKPDYDKASSLVNELNWLPSFISKATLNIVNKLKEQYPNGLENIILELKSCSSFMFELYEKNGVSSTNHELQCFHYLKAKHHHEGHIVYISKDDARMIEIGVFNPSKTEEKYRKDIETLTEYFKSDTQPPLEKTITFDEMFNKFSANWKVGYSGYLTKLYGLKSQKDFDDKYKPVVQRWNRVLGRIINEDNMTDKNKIAIDEITKEGFDIEKIKASLPKKEGAK